MKLKVTLVHSGIGCDGRQRATLKGLGLKRLNKSRVLVDTPQVRGMVRVEDRDGAHVRSCQKPAQS